LWRGQREARDRSWDLTTLAAPPPVTAMPSSDDGDDDDARLGAGDDNGTGE